MEQGRLSAPCKPLLLRGAPSSNLTSAGDVESHPEVSPCSITKAATSACLHGASQRLSQALRGGPPSLLSSAYSAATDTPWFLSAFRELDEPSMPH